MNLQQLRAICEVVDNGMSISEAARALHMTQPAVSKQIRAFETEMRTEVFVRSKGRLTALTPAGMKIREAAGTALSSLAEIRSICSQDEDAAPNQFSIAASRSMALNVLPGIVQRFMTQYPGAEITIVHGSLPKMAELILDGEVSLALTIENGVQEEPIVALPFDQIPRVIVVPTGHPLLVKRDISLQDVAAFPLVLYDDSFSVRGEILETFKKQRLQPKIAVNASGAEIIKAYVGRGLGITVLAKTSYDAAFDTGLAAIPADHLFTPAITRILFSQNHFLRKFEYDFIQLCAPKWTKREILRHLDSRSPASLPEDKPSRAVEA